MKIKKICCELPFVRPGGVVVWCRLSHRKPGSSVRFLKFGGPAVGRPHPWRGRCGKRKVWSRKRGIKASSDVMSRGDWEADEPAKCVTFLYIDTFVIACVSRFCTMCALKEM